MQTPRKPLRLAARRLRSSTNGRRVSGLSVSILEGMGEPSWLDEERPTEQISRASLFIPRAQGADPWSEDEATEVELDLGGALAAILERLPQRRRASSRAGLDETRLTAVDEPKGRSAWRQSSLRERTQPADLLVIAEEAADDLASLVIDLSLGTLDLDELEELDPSLLVEI